MRYPFVLFLAAVPLLADVNSTVYIPHIVDGGAWETTFTFVNLSTRAPAQGTLHLWAEDGNALSLALTGVAGGPRSQLDVTIPAGGMTTVTTGSQDPYNTTLGWADFDVQTSGLVAVSALMRQRIAGRPDYEVFVPSRRVATASQIFLFDHRYGGFATGIGMMNASRFNTGTINVTIRNESGTVIQDESGRPMQNVVVTLRPGAHASFSLGDQFPTTQGQRGTIELNPQPGGWLAFIGLRFNPTGPITALDAMTP